MFMVALISAHQLLVNFGFSFKTVVKNKEECVGKCFSNKENKKKNCFLKGKHETKKCFQINKENQENKNCLVCVCPKWSGVAPCADRQKITLSGLFSVGSKVGGRRLSSSLCRRVVKLVILRPRCHFRRST